MCVCVSLYVHVHIDTLTPSGRGLVHKCVCVALSVVACVDATIRAALLVMKLDVCLSPCSGCGVHPWQGCNP